MTGDDPKLPLFQGNATEDPKQYWFLCKVVWTVKQVQDHDIKKGQVEMTFRGQSFDQYMEFVTSPQNMTKTYEV